MPYFFGLEIKRKPRRLPSSKPRPLDMLTLASVKALRDRIGPAAPLPEGSGAKCYPVRQGGLRVCAPSEHDNIYPVAPAIAAAIVRPVRLLDTLQWAWALDNPVEDA